MTVHDTDCQGCGATFDQPLSLLDGQLVGPFVTLRVRSTAGERSQRALLVTCPNCGLLSLYDADWVQREIDSTRAEPLASE